MNDHDPTTVVEVIAAAIVDAFHLDPVDVDYVIGRAIGNYQGAPAIHRSSLLRVKAP